MRTAPLLLLVLAACPGDRTKGSLQGPDDDHTAPVDASVSAFDPRAPILAEGNDAIVPCDEETPHLAPVDPRDWPAELGWARVDEIVFRVGCQSRSLLENHLAGHERAVVGCFAERLEDVPTTVVLRTEWIAADYTSEITRSELPGADDDALRGCLEAVLAQLGWRSLEREQRTVVDVQITRGFFPPDATGPIR